MITALAPWASPLLGRDVALDATGLAVGAAISIGGVGPRAVVLRDQLRTA